MNDSFKMAGEVVQSFVSVNRALTRFTQQNAASLSLTVPQMGILNAIFAKMGSTLKDITERLQMPKSTASIVLDDLVKMGLVERKASEDDRREVNLTVTEKGAGLSNKSISNSSSYRAMQYALDQMPEQDFQALLGLHGAILQNLKEYEETMQHGG